MRLTLSRQLSVFALLLVSALTSAVIADGYNISDVKSYSGKFKAQTPIDIGLNVNGVKLDSVFFDKKNLQAFIILLNRTPVAVNPTVGISIHDKKGRVIATGIDEAEFSFSGDSIDAGAQKSIKLDLNKFISNFKDAKSFQIIFSIGEKAQSSNNSSYSSDDD